MGSDGAVLGMGKKGARREGLWRKNWQDATTDSSSGARAGGRETVLRVLRGQDRAHRRPFGNMLVRKLLLFLQGTGLFGLRGAHSRAVSCPVRTECLLSVRCCAPCMQPIVSLLFSLCSGSGHAGIPGCRGQW